MHCRRIVLTSVDSKDTNIPQSKGTSRRSFLKYGIAGAVVVAAAAGGAYYYLDYLPKNTTNKNNLVIAWNSQIQSLTPYGAINANVPLESPLYAIFDQYVIQDINLKLQPGIVTSWNWNSDFSAIDLAVRNDVKFHNGDALTADDVAFSMQTAAQTGSHYAAIWGKIASINVNSSTSLTLNMKAYDPAFTTWLCFIESFVLPKNYYTQVGASGFASKPIGTGPYQFVSYQNGVLTLKSYPDYWNGVAPIENVIFKEVTDQASRLAEVQSGTSDFTLQVDITSFKNLPSNLTGLKPYTTDIATFFVAPYFQPFSDQRVRLAVAHAIDKQSLVNNVLLGFGRALSMPEAPGYQAYDANFNFAYDQQMATSLLQAAGYSQSNPLSLNIMATNGVTTQDYAIAQAVAQMLQNVGIKVTIDTVTVAQWFAARSAGNLDALSFYVWSNATGDPENDIGDQMSPNSPFSAWAGVVNGGKTDYTGLMSEAKTMTDPIFTEKDQQTRVQAAVTASEWAVNQGLIMPLYQQAQPIVMKSNLNYTPWPQGWIRPNDMSWS